MSLTHDIRHSSYEPQYNKHIMSIHHIKRQYSKSDLASLVEDTATNLGGCVSAVDESCRPPTGRRHASQQRMSLTSKDVLQLLYPTPQVDEGARSHEIGSSSVDDDDDDGIEEHSSSSQQVSDHILRQTMTELGREVRKFTVTYAHRTT